MLSIIVPTLNEEKYISDLLICLSEQDYRNFELIIVDSNSDDNTIKTAEVIAGCFGVSMRFIQTDIRNTSMQRNIGARAAIGEKLVFIDADIIIPRKDFLRKINLKLNHHASVAVPVKVNPKEESAADSIISDFLNGLMILLNSIGIANGRGAVIGAGKEEFHKAGGFNEEMAVAEDVDLFRKLARFGKPGVLSYVVYESARRYRKTGYIRLFSSWTLNGMWSFIFRRSLVRQWKEVR